MYVVVIQNNKAAKLKSDDVPFLLFFIVEMIVKYHRGHRETMGPSHDI
jgi:hypothetical protein